MPTDVQEPKRIIVTGVGGAPGFDLSRRLMHLGCRVIAADANPLAWGLLLPGVTPMTLPTASHPDYTAAFLALCQEARPDAIVSTVEPELPHLVALVEPLAELGIRTWLPGIRAVDVCGDKAQFHAVMAARSIPTPRTFLPHEISRIRDGRELVVKPRRGYGSQNVYFCRTKAQAETLCELMPDPLVQEKAQGREFTADCLRDDAGRSSVILRWRLLVKAGLSVVSETFHDQAVTDLVKQVLDAVDMVGVCCVQGFVEDGAGGGVVTEMNARIAGAFPLAETAGADLTGQLLRGLFRLPVDHDRLTYKPGIRLTKCFETLSADERTQ